MRIRPTLTIVNGSSPRVRGTVLMMVRRSVSLRFIPTCAGNSCCSRSSVCLVTVHPRVCGEQLRISRVDHQTGGSSPRVRGTDAMPIAPRNTRGFIPACAGNSCQNSNLATDPPVHPRVCGEQRNHLVQQAAQCGSSPRVRGTASRLLGGKTRRRFIPACAGNRPGTLGPSL